jgi:hypothetical protein
VKALFKEYRQVHELESVWPMLSYVSYRPKQRSIKEEVPRLPITGCQDSPLPHPTHTPHPERCRFQKMSTDLRSWLLHEAVKEKTGIRQVSIIWFYCFLIHGLVAEI